MYLYLGTVIKLYPNLHCANQLIITCLWCKPSAQSCLCLLYIHVQYQNLFTVGTLSGRSSLENCAWHVVLVWLLVN